MPPGPRAPPFGKAVATLGADCSRRALELAARPCGVPPAETERSVHAPLLWCCRSVRYAASPLDPIIHTTGQIEVKGPATTGEILAK